MYPHDGEGGAASAVVATDSTSVNADSDNGGRALRVMPRSRVCDGDTAHGRLAAVAGPQGRYA